MSCLLSIDPGTHHFGLAVWVDCALWKAWLVKSEIVDVRGLHFDEIVCERPQVYLSNLKAANDMVALGIAAGELVGRIQSRPTGVEVTYIFPSTWKGSTPKPEPKRGWSPDDYAITHRARAALTAEEFSRIELPGDKKNQLDVWDAIGIGLFHLRRVGRGCIRRSA